MNERRHITMLAAALMFCSVGCGDTIVHDAYIEVAPIPKKVSPAKPSSPPVFATPGEPVALPISFDDLNLNMKIDVPFREDMLTEKVKEVVGKRVRLKGVMHGSLPNLKQVDQFILLRNKEFRNWSPADTLVEVKMRTGESTKYTQNRLDVEGTLRIEPKTGDDGNTWSIYILEEATLPNEQPADKN